MFSYCSSFMHVTNILETRRKLTIHIVSEARDLKEGGVTCSHANVAQLLAL